MTKDEKFLKRVKAVGFSSAPSDQFGGCIDFEQINAANARDLIDCGCAEPDGNTNASPTYEEITVFLEQNPCFVAHGYIIVPSRSDERITLTGVIAASDPPEEQVRNFVKMFRRADEFDLTTYRAWYD